MTLRFSGRIAHLVDDTELVEALVNYLKKQMLLVDAVFFDLEVVRL